MPKFSYEYESGLNDALKKLGMNSAFDESKADFSKMGKSSNGNIFISEVKHKTFICVDERGTKAGAGRTGAAALRTVIRIHIVSHKLYNTLAATTSRACTQRARTTAGVCGKSRKKSGKKRPWPRRNGNKARKNWAKARENWA